MRAGDWKIFQKKGEAYSGPKSIRVPVLLFHKPYNLRSP